ncbi:MAG: alpha/beta hydrolase [Planctomycetota bacterium]|jgi:phospholipase/carboxylesterase
MASRTRTVKKGFQVETRNLLFLPKGYRSTRSYPLVVALHGMGMNADEFAEFLEPLRSLPILLFVPEGVYPFEIHTGERIDIGRAWYLYTGNDQEFVSSMVATGRHVLTLIDRVEKEHAVDPGRRVLLGFSQGGYFAGYLGVREAARFKGLVVMGARVKDEVLQKQLKRAKDLSVFLLHGRKDRSVPFQFAERSREALEGAGLDVRLKAYDSGHYVTNEEVRDVRTWLKKLLSLR